MKEKFNWKLFTIVTLITAIFTFLSLNMLFPKNISEISLADKNCTEWRGIFIPHRENNITVNYTMRNSGDVYELMFDKWNYTTVYDEYYDKSWDREQFFNEWCAIYEAEGIRHGE